MKTLLVVAVAVLVAGCLAPTPPSGSSTTGATASGSATDATTSDPTASGTSTVTTSPAPKDALFILLRNPYWINETSGSGEGYRYGNFPHCGVAGYELDPDLVHLVRYGGGPANPPESVLVRDYDNRTTVPFPTTGHPSANAEQDSNASAAEYPILSPFDYQRVLANVTVTGESVLVDGQALPEGGLRVLVKTYIVSHQDKRYEVTERLEFENRGRTPVDVDVNDQYCI